MRGFFCSGALGCHALAGSARGLTGTPTVRRPHGCPVHAQEAHRGRGLGPKFGYDEVQEARFANDDLEVEQTGVSHLRVKAGKRQPFAHKHDEAEEVYVVLAGSGRLKLDDEIIEVTELDAIRVSPGVTRAFEGGSDGIEVLAFGPHHEGDGEVFPGWWSD